MKTDKIYNKATSWYVVNLKARTNQCPRHYVDAIHKIKEQDPLIEVRGNKCISVHSMEECNILDNDGLPKWIKLVITHYTIVDPNAFYNIREHKDVNMDWDKDIVANKKEAELFIIPSVHKVIVKKSTKISLNNIVTYLKGSLDRVEEETFDVTIVLEHDFIQRIVSAHSVISFDAHISFSNPGHSSGFAKVFEDKVKGMNPNSLDIAAKGSVKNPLNKEKDGLIHAACTLAEENGTIDAKIKDTETSKPVAVSSAKYPRVLRLSHYVNDIVSTVYNEVRTIFAEDHGR